MFDKGQVVDTFVLLGFRHEVAYLWVEMVVVEKVREDVVEFDI